LGRAESYATLAVNTVFVPTANYVVFSIVIVRIIRALVNANFAADTSVLISFNEIFRKQVSFHFIFPPHKLRP
jgi:hypothetical protein